MSRLLRVLILTTVSIGLFAAIGAILPGIDAFEPIGKSLNDIAVTDIFYSATRNDTPVENDKFLIIDTSDSDRGEIARAIDHASSADAAVIGVDIVFSDPGTDTLATAALCEAMDRSRDKIVAAVHLNSWDEATQSYISTVSTAIDSLGLQQAYTNFITHSDNSYIRNYSVAAPGLTPSFAQCVADRYRSVYEDDTVIEPTSEGIVDFTPQHFDVVDAADLAAIDTMAFGRMVLLGSVGGDEDYHFTPIGSMSGVVIQAYSIDTILNSATTMLPQWVVWCVCVLLVVLASYGFIVLRDNFESRNTVANRYTYAFLGLGNIIYPTITILLTIFFIGLLYLITLIYLPPLVIAGSLAFIPVAYDLMGIAKAVCFRRTTKAAAILVCGLLASTNADAQRTHQDYLNDIEYLNRNCPFEKGKLKESIHPEVAQVIMNLYFRNSEMPVDNDIYTAALECLAADSVIIEADVALSDSYLYSVDSPYLNKGVDLLVAGLPIYDGFYWYKLALCYYFGLGTYVDYYISSECLDRSYDIYKKATEEEREQYFFYSKAGALNILGSCLRAKGYPNKVCDAQHGSMTLNRRDGIIRNKLISDCELALIAEDPERLLDGFPNCKLKISPDNFLRFYPIIVKKGLAKKFLDKCANATWQDNLLTGLIYYHYYDTKFQTFTFEHPLTKETSLEGFSNNGNKDFISAKYFKKALALFNSDSKTKLSDEQQKYIKDFIVTYQILSGGNEGKVPSSLISREKLMAGALSRVLAEKYDMEFLWWFNPTHYEMIERASLDGDDIATFLLGYMYKTGDFSGYDKDTEKARKVLSKWADKSDGMTYIFDCPADLCKFVIDNCKPGGLDEIAKVAAYEYSTLPEPIPAGKFRDELMARVRVIEMQKHMAVKADSLNNVIDSFVAKPTTNQTNQSKSRNTANINQNKSAKVHGTVSDVNGEPLIGASIKVDGTNIVATSDMDGCFDIAVKKGDRIALSYIGYEPASFVYDGQKINVVLKEAKDNKKWSASDETMTSTSKKQTTQTPKNQPQPQPQPAPAAKPKVNFAFRTPNNTKFSEPEFDLTFVTNSRTATYRITGSEPQDIPASALSSGKLRITLPKRDCELTLVDESNKMHVLSFIYDEALSLRKSATLHILSIGINNYPAQNLENLRFAEADAAAVVDAFVKRHRYTFSNINKTVLLGNKVTRRSIETEIEKISENAKPNDLAVIFFAGHGLVDSKKYFLATSEVDDAQRPNRGGLSATLFKEKIDYIPCKLVVFIDACHSAKVFDAFRSNDFFKELQSSRNGTDIYTSSGSDERSREDSKFGHGYFTQALIEACDFKNSDKDGDGRITVKEIRNYLEWRIPELTANQQNPDYRNIESSDYSIFIKQ